MYWKNNEVYFCFNGFSLLCGYVSGHFIFCKSYKFFFVIIKFIYIKKNRYGRYSFLISDKTVYKNKNQT